MWAFRAKSHSHACIRAVSGAWAFPNVCVWESVLNPVISSGFQVVGGTFFHFLMQFKTLSSTESSPAFSSGIQEL
jgi:hypothetical protein